MTKFSKILLTSAIGLMLAGCAGNNISKEAREAVGWESAPQWVIDGHDGGYSAVGDAPIVDKNVQFARTEATAAARAELAKRIEARVLSNLTKQAVRTDGQIKEEVSNTIKEAAQRNLQGVKTEKTWIDDAGIRIYILVKLEKEATKDLQNKLAKQFKTLDPSKILDEQE
ncbi:LPP20 family lipoprotein [Helicobacter anatolicus]|uniref:LPP20 family lipoprotein n=1 Tax=Helicobacter anatolicus TaxID=2905874 RepID=UPI001E64D8DC|nr:LPP20 family lipoprotein [Helicobacter anatolicus]MCE3037982.1 LPP20 family lipoprotein [Helicobacter anatolicus]